MPKSLYIVNICEAYRGQPTRDRNCHTCEVWSCPEQSIHSYSRQLCTESSTHTNTPLS